MLNAEVGYDNYCSYHQKDHDKQRYKALLVWHKLFHLDFIIAYYFRLVQ